MISHLPQTVFLVFMETTARKSVGNVIMAQAATGLPVCVQMDAKNIGYYRFAQVQSCDPDS